MRMRKKKKFIGTGNGLWLFYDNQISQALKETNFFFILDAVCYDENGWAVSWYGLATGGSWTVNFIGFFLGFFFSYIHETTMRTVRLYIGVWMNGWTDGWMREKMYVFMCDADPARPNPIKRHGIDDKSVEEKNIKHLLIDVAMKWVIFILKNYYYNHLCGHKKGRQLVSPPNSDCCVHRNFIYISKH